MGICSLNIIMYLQSGLRLRSEVEDLAEHVRPDATLLDPSADHAHLASVTPMAVVVDQVGDLLHAVKQTGRDPDRAMALCDLCSAGNARDEVALAKSTGERTRMNEGDVLFWNEGMSDQLTDLIQPRNSWTALGFPSRQRIPGLPARLSKERGQKRSTSSTGSPYYAHLRGRSP